MLSKHALIGSILLFLGVLAVPHSVEAGTLIGTSLGVIYDIDPLTGVAGNPRDTGGIAGSIEYTGGALYGASARSLYRIDIVSGVTDLLGDLDGLEVPQTVYDLAWDETSETLYALVHRGGTTSDFLFTVDTTTFGVTEVGRLDNSTSTIAFDSTGALFAVNPVDDTVAILDKTDASVISTVPITPPPGLGAAMAFGEGGTLFVATDVADDPSVLFTLDPATGALDLLGSAGLEHDLLSLTYIPEPGTLLLLIAGVLGFWVVPHPCVARVGDGSIRRLATNSPDPG
ncbi:MAG: hypothetical protein KJ749_12045 [Planctomycetes bacterium]|nr:hypothetical protein [Planctomycetota bacterium]